MTDSTSTKNSERAKLKFNTARSMYCCGVLEIGEFELEQLQRWARNPPPVIKVSFEDGLTLFAQQLTERINEEYGPSPGDYGDEDIPSDEYVGDCLVTATVAEYRASALKGAENPQIVAEEYLIAAGFEKVSEFKNVNSGNKVRKYQKLFNAGDIIREAF